MFYLINSRHQSVERIFNSKSSIRSVDSYFRQAGAELGQAQPELGLEDRVLCCGLNFEAEA